MADEKQVLSFLYSDRADRKAAYLQAGRAFEQLSADALFAEWVSVFRQMAVDPTDSNIRGRHSELESEIEARDMEPPYHLVQGELDAFTAKVDELMNDLKNSDPDEWLRINAELEGDLQEFHIRSTKGSN